MVVSDYGYGDVGIHDTFVKKADAIKFCMDNLDIGFNPGSLFDSDLIHYIRERFIND